MTEFFTQEEIYEGEEALVIYNKEDKRKLAILTFADNDEFASKLRLAAKIVKFARKVAGDRPIQAGVKEICDEYKNRKQKYEELERKVKERKEREEADRKKAMEAIERNIPKFERNSYIRDFRPTTLEEVASMYAQNHSECSDCCAKVHKESRTPGVTTLEEVAKFYADQKRNERPHIRGTGFIIIL